MTQNIYDNPEFFAGYSQLKRSRQGLDGAPEWPALRAMLPGLGGLRVLDLGCGFGWFCRWAHQAGAASVVGLDVSDQMLDQARATTTDEAIRYERTDAEHLSLPDSAYDLIYSSLVLHYIARLEPLFGTLHRALVPGGRFVFSMEHPIYTAPATPGWVLDAEGRRTWPIDGYLREGPRTTDWLAHGVVKQHRTIGTLLSMLLRAGFTLTGIEEWQPTEAQIAAQPDLAAELDRPMFLLVSARR
jgi:ubiquinone/menaquinone biosynthesis C-methylase UbiE